MGPFNEVMEIFAPGFRHLQDEKERQQMTLHIPGDAADPLGVDLDKGVVRITRPAAEPDDEQAG